MIGWHCVSIARADAKDLFEVRARLVPAQLGGIRDMAAAKGLTPDQVSASNSSFGNEVSLIDPASGRLGLVWNVVRVSPERQAAKALPGAGPSPLPTAPS